MKRLMLSLLVACGTTSAPSPPPPPPLSHKPSDTGAVTEEQFKAMHAEPTAGPAKVDGKMFELAGTRAYLALPKGQGPFPAIIVIHEWWG